MSDMSGTEHSVIVAGENNNTTSLNCTCGWYFHCSWYPTFDAVAAAVAQHLVDVKEEESA